MSTVFIYYPLKDTVNPVPPPVTLEDPGVAGVNFGSGDNSTSADVIIVAKNRQQLIQNPDFYSSPDSWYCYPSKNLNCYWLSYDTDASGGVGQIYGRTRFLSSEQAYLLQRVTIPNVPVTSAQLTVRMRAQQCPVGCQYVVGLSDADNGTTTWYTTGTPGSSYSRKSWNVASHINPGRKYWVFIGVNSGWLGGTVDFRVDYVYLNLRFDRYVFLGNSVGINNTDTQGYVCRLILDRWLTRHDFNATVFLRNYYLQESSRIVIENGVPLVSSTNYTAIPHPAPGYMSAYVVVNGTKFNIDSNYLYMLLEYCTPSASVCVYYPIKIEFDPPFIEGNSYSHKNDWHTENLVNSVLPIMEVNPFRGINMLPPSNNSSDGLG
ncbi:MAG: hypothetical protein GSR83_04030 [Desulfurococcales archaeon]|nr:hypothetical protein [Desulfurococcales archaeon]